MLHSTIPHSTIFEHRMTWVLFFKLLFASISSRIRQIAPRIIYSPVKDRGNTFSLSVLLAIIKSIIDLQLKTIEIYVSVCWRLGNPRSRWSPIWFLVRNPLPGFQMELFLPCPHIEKREKETISKLSLCLFLMRALIRSWNSILWPNCLPKAPSPNSILKHVDFGGSIQAQSWYHKINHYNFGGILSLFSQHSDHINIFHWEDYFPGSSTVLGMYRHLLKIHNLLIYPHIC